MSEQDQRHRVYSTQKSGGGSIVIQTSRSRSPGDFEIEFSEDDLDQSLTTIVFCLLKLYYFQIEKVIF